MQVPIPNGTPMPLSEEVVGSLSGLESQIQAAQPDIQNAYAMHWMAMRQSGNVPAFQQMTQHMLWGLYGTTALSGLLRHATSGGASPDVMAGIIDQVRLVQHSYGQAAEALQEFLEVPEVRDYDTARPMARSFRPLDQVYQAVQPPMQTVTGTVQWHPGAPLAMVPIQQAMLVGYGDAVELLQP